MRYFYFLLNFLLVCSISCKKDKPITSSNSTNPSNSSLSEAKVPVNSLVKLRRADEAFIKESSSQKPYNMITDSIWNFYFALSISEPTPKDNLYKGRWIDLRDDGTYQQGEYNLTTDEGRYIYRQDKKNIEFRSTQKDTSSEWTLKVDPDAMVLIGTEKYSNNPWQIKLLRKSGKPEMGVPLKNEKSN